MRIISPSSENKFFANAIRVWPHYKYYFFNNNYISIYSFYCFNIFLLFPHLKITFYQLSTFHCRVIFFLFCSLSRFASQLETLLRRKDKNSDKFVMN